MVVEQSTQNLEASRSESRNAELEAFYRDLEENGMDALWRDARRPGPSEGSDTERRAPYPPYRWKWSVIRPFMDRAGRLVEPGPEAERRVVRLIHPALGTIRAASHTLTGNVQMVLPGEIAPSHRHTSGAIRFILEGQAAVTIVNGEPVEMKPGDLVLTPGWSWHGHINESDGPMLWMDTLDRPLTVALRQMLQEQYPGQLEPITKSAGESFNRYGAGFLRPTGSRSYSPVSPLLIFPWMETEQALQGLAKLEADPYDDIAFDYVNPLTGGHVLPTIGCKIQLLRPGIHTRAHRHSWCGVHQVFRGSGRTIVDGIRVDWEKGDFFTIPPYAWHEHINDTAEEAILFSTTDAPVVESLNFASSDLYVENDGHQLVGSVFSEDSNLKSR